jgi:thioredoxin reductase
MALNLTTWTDRIVIFTNGAPAEMTQPYLDKLEALNIPVLEAKVKSVVSENGNIKCMNLEGGMSLDCQRLYFAIGQYPADDLGAQLKCERDEGGHIKVDERNRTSVLNVFAAGDIVPGPQLAIAAASDGAVAALAIHASLVPESRRLD